MHQSLRRPLLPLLLAASLSSAEELCFTGGLLGGAVTYELTGDAGDLYLLVPSLTGGPTPLALFDPSDPRLLDVGADLFSLATLGVFGGAPAEVLYPLPAVPALAGVALHAQFVTISGATTTLVDELSNPVAFTLGAPQSSVFTASDVVTPRRGHSLSLLPDGRVLVSGGERPDGLGGIVEALDTLELYDPKTQTFTQLATTLNSRRSAHSATALADGRVLILGGYNDPANAIARKTGEIWDPAAPDGALNFKIANMQERRTQHTATLLADGRVLVTGGIEIFDLSDPFGSMATANGATEVYDPATDTWQQGPSLPGCGNTIGTFGHNATLLPSGRVLVGGGVCVFNLFGIPTPQFSAACARYDAGSNTMLSTASMPTGLAYPALTTLSDGTALMAGGADGNFVLFSFTPRTDVNRYDEGADSWSSSPSLTTPRAYGELVELPGGRLVHVGGLKLLDLVVDFGTPEPIIETASLPGLAWSTSATQTMLLPRELARAVPLDDTRVLSVGVANYGIAPTDVTAEVYAP